MKNIIVMASKSRGVLQQAHSHDFIWGEAQHPFDIPSMGQNVIFYQFFFTNLERAYLRNYGLYLKMNYRRNIKAHSKMLYYSIFSCL